MRSTCADGVRGLAALVLEATRSLSASVVPSRIHGTSTGCFASCLAGCLVIREQGCNRKRVRSSKKASCASPRAYAAKRYVSRSMPVATEHRRMGSRVDDWVDDRLVVDR